MDANRLWRALTNHWRVALGLFLAALAVSGFSAVTSPSVYTATTTLSVGPRATGSDYYSQLQAVTFLMPSLQAQLQTDELQTAVVSAAPPAVAADQFSLSSSVQPGTGILRITVTSPAKDAVAPLANGYAAALRTAQAGDSPLRITVLDPARTPAVASGPARTSMLLSGAVLGALLALLGAWLMQRWRHSRSLLSTIRERFGVPVLGQIPLFVTKNRGYPVGPAEFFAGDDHYAIEAYLRLRTNVELQLTRRELATVTVISRGMGDGKSTVAAMLSWSMSLAGHRVTLIEGDLRRPSLRQRFPTARMDVPARIRVGDHDHVLTLYTSDMVRMAAPRQRGRASLHPADVIADGGLELIRQVASPQGLVVVDSPPLLGAAEARLLLGSTDGVVVVVNGRSRRVLDELAEALEQVQEAGGWLLGVVVNRARMPKRDTRGLHEYYLAPQNQVLGSSPLMSPQN